MPGQILTAGTVITMDHRRPRARAVAISDVGGTWLGGERIDLDAFVGAVGGTDGSAHAHLAQRSTQRGCC